MDRILLSAAALCLLPALGCARLSDDASHWPAPPAALITHRLTDTSSTIPDSCLMDDEPTAGEEAGLVQDFRLQLFLVRQLTTCFVGDPCGPGTACVGLNRRGARAVKFADNENFVSVAPSDPRVRGRADAVCLTMSLSDEDVAWLSEEVSRFIEDSNLFTQGGVVLELEVVSLQSMEAALSRIGNGFWLAPFGLEKVLRPHLKAETDFIMLSHGIMDPSGMYFDVGACGLTYGSDYGIGGAGYSWVPKTSPAFPFECAEHGVFTHEWLHQVEFAQWYLSGRDDIYLSRRTGTHNYPPCGQANHSPLHWFPSTHDCTSDPDSPDCGGTCSGNESINEHILRAHFNRNIPLVTNHCRNGIRDHGEHGVDVGGNCLAGL